MLGGTEVPLRQVVVDQGPETAHTPRLALVQRLLHARVGVVPGAFQRLGNQRVTRSEMGIEAAMGEPGLLHDVRHADPGKTTAAQGTRRRIDDAVVRQLLAAGGEGHGVLADVRMAAS
ncbi:hypothetical protein AZ34_03460 [Hylemonella gracilis str. Niagara R]|uniref:Uncharacterized protein n=1 Tax=Hylemonella gracilis str. Niagara R TaxID=1458275 RepID=A0A016XLI9_9BURK|nr:hypothetical protein AZ34_03460 [Hylemonella gracilis str. Niagara R]